MKTLTFALLLLVTAALATDVTAAHAEQYTLEFIPTQNAPPGARASMAMKVVDGETIVHFRARGLYAHTVYTIWIVYNGLQGPPGPPPSRDEMVAFFQTLTDNKVPSCSASGPDDDPGCAGWTGRPGFPKEGNGVAPLAPLGAGFTGGMGFDPGATFVTNANGDGELQLRVDYDLLGGEPNGAPVANRDIIVQCVPGPVAADGKTCPAPSKQMRVTTTWLRRYIGQYPLAERAASCANYDPVADPENAAYDGIISNGANARLWQCTDPGTLTKRSGALPRVYRFEWNHFRLANHPDDLTHGFIGGNGIDHWIDLVGRRVDLKPAPKRFR